MLDAHGELMQTLLSPAKGAEGLHVHAAAQSLGTGVHVLELSAVASEARVGLYGHVTWARARHASHCNKQRKQTVHCRGREETSCYGHVSRVNRRSVPMLAVVTHRAIFVMVGK